MVVRHLLVSSNDQTALSIPAANELFSLLTRGAECGGCRGKYACADDPSSPKEQRPDDAVG